NHVCRSDHCAGAGAAVGFDGARTDVVFFADGCSGALTGAVSCAPGASWPVVRPRAGTLRTEPHISLDAAGIRSAARTRTATRRSSVVRRTVFAGTHACALLARACDAA